MIDVVLWISFVIMCIALIVTFIRLVLGPTLPDRVVMLELMALLSVAFIGLYSIKSGHSAFLDVALVLALTAFLAAVGFARYLEKGGLHDDD
ncbi:monovalent cation/H+ antiporter complex subunit F [Alcanivorax limicola]|uniref:monovalent cation/H+ antiporter complex subunit F n=1 Tax=Alcanivorax limicola TaxID=2874102 RepID=UPI001CBF9C93|nr:monovalent cation/H+ antiporter complex subunit F [Alcanivorax limicola]